MLSGVTYTFYSDGGHGWLEVPISHVVDLGIADKVSTFSYINRPYVYLEEDCDAALFFHAYQAKFGCKPQYIEKYEDGECFVRSLNHVGRS